MARIASSGSGARPRLVWMTIPVALITRRGDGASRSAISAGSRDRTISVHSPRLRSADSASRRNPEIVLRMASTTTARGICVRIRRISSVSSREATDGRLRNRSDSGIVGSAGSPLREFPEQDLLPVKGVLDNEGFRQFGVSLPERLDDLPVLPDRALDLPPH